MTSSSYDYSPPSCAKDFACKAPWGSKGTQFASDVVAAMNKLNSMSVPSLCVALVPDPPQTAAQIGAQEHAACARPSMQG